MSTLNLKQSGTDWYVTASNGVQYHISSYRNLPELGKIGKGYALYFRIYSTMNLIHVITGDIFPDQKNHYSLKPWDIDRHQIRELIDVHSILRIPISNYFRDASAQPLQYRTPSYTDYGSDWNRKYQEHMAAQKKQITNTEINPKTETKTENKVKKNLFSNLGLEFGQVTDGKYALSPFGGIAFKNKEGDYVSFDLESNTITEIGDMTFDVNGAIWRMPVAHENITRGDVIEKNGLALIVTTVHQDGSISGVVPTTGSKTTKVKRQHMFGFSFYTKIVSMFDFSAMSGGQSPVGSFNPMMLMLLGSKDSGTDNSSLMETMMMMQMMGSGNGNPFAAMMGQTKKSGKR